MIDGCWLPTAVVAVMGKACMDVCMCLWVVYESHDGKWGTKYVPFFFFLVRSFSGSASLVCMAPYEEAT